MQIDRLMDKRLKKVVGIKQSHRIIKEGSASYAYIAADSEERIKHSIISLCQEHGVEYEMVPTMKELGEKSGIQVGAAVTVIIK